MHLPTLFSKLISNALCQPWPVLFSHFTSYFLYISYRSFCFKLAHLVVQPLLNIVVFFYSVKLSISRFLHPLWSSLSALAILSLKTDPWAFFTSELSLLFYYCFSFYTPCAFYRLFFIHCYLSHMIFAQKLSSLNFRYLNHSCDYSRSHLYSLFVLTVLHLLVSFYWSQWRWQGVDWGGHVHPSFSEWYLFISKNSVKMVGYKLENLILYFFHSTFTGLVTPLHSIKHSLRIIWQFLFSLLPTFIIFRHV